MAGVTPLVSRPLKLTNATPADKKFDVGWNAKWEQKQDNKEAARTGGGSTSGSGGGPRLATSTFGLNTNDKTPFNPFAMPKNVGAFNREVLAQAQPQYLPQLQGLASQGAAEKTANTERVGDIGSIYNQYGQQAQDAFNEVQAALKDLALENSGGNGIAQANLGAALNAATAPGSSLGGMMGGVSDPGANAQPYASAAQAMSGAVADQEQGLAEGTLSGAGQNLINVGLERATEQNTESLRHGAAMQGLESQREAIAQQIPDIIQKARENLISDLENSQALQFQQNLASKQFGLSSQAQSFNQAQTKTAFKETQLNDASNRRAQAAQISQNAQALANQQAATQEAAAAALAKAQGQQQANAIKYLTSWLAPTKEELKTVTNNSGANPTKQTVLADPKTWHRDVGSALRTLMTVYGLDQNTALQMMAAVGGSTYVSGQGGQTVAQWANTFAARSRQDAAANRLTKGVKTLSSGLTGIF